MSVTNIWGTTPASKCSHFDTIILVNAAVAVIPMTLKFQNWRSLKPARCTPKRFSVPSSQILIMHRNYKPIDVTQRTVYLGQNNKVWCQICAVLMLLTPHLASKSSLLKTCLEFSATASLTLSNNSQENMEWSNL